MSSFFDSLKPWTPKCRYDDASICCHLSCEMDGCDRFGILRERGFFRSSNSRFPILRWDRISPHVSWSDGQDDVGISQVKETLVHSTRLTVVQLLADPTAVGPVFKIWRLKILSSISRSPRPFWTSFPPWICSQDELHGFNGCSLCLRCVLSWI